MGARFALFHRWLSLLALWLALFGKANAEPAKRAIVLSWDGAANWVVDRLLAEGRLPNVARLARMGVRMEYSTPAYPSKTFPGHAALWTGAYGEVNGISDNDSPLFPRAAHTLLESQFGGQLQAEALWLTAARAGKKVATLSMPFAGPPDQRLTPLQGAGIPADRFAGAGSFGTAIAPDMLHDGKNLLPATGWTGLPPHRGSPRELDFSVGDTLFYLLVYDDPTSPTAGANTVLIREGSKEAVRATATASLKPVEAEPGIRHFSRRFRVTKGDVFGYTYFRLFSLAPDGRMVLYQRGVNGRRVNEPKERIRHLEAVGGYFAVPFGPYQKGELGATLWEGGDGTAERRLLECIRLDSEFLRKGARFALREWHPDLLFHYLPTTDEAGHVWMGALDPDCPGYNEALARKLWPYYAAVYQIQDEGLGDILDHIDKDTVVCLVSDHGMAGTYRMVSVNDILEKAGLLARTADNQIDLAHTKICAPAWSDYFLVVNGTDWKGGIVPPAEREAVLRAAMEALLSTTDPLTGRHIVTGVFRPDQMVGLGMGGPTGGDLYFDLAPAYEPTNGLTADAIWTWPSPIALGAHGFWSLRTKMQAICFMGGAGVARGLRLPGMRAIDFAPTLARLLGIPAPRDARGHALVRVLANPSR